MAMLVITRGYLKIMQGSSFCNDPKSHDGITAHYQPLGRCRVAGAVAIFASESSGPCSTLISVSSSQNFRTCIEPADVDQEISRDIKSRNLQTSVKPASWQFSAEFSGPYMPWYMVHGTWYMVDSVDGLITIPQSWRDLGVGCTIKKTPKLWSLSICYRNREMQTPKKIEF